MKPFTRNVFKNDEKVKNLKNIFQKIKKPRNKKIKGGSVVLEGSNYIKKGEVENRKT